MRGLLCCCFVNKSCLALWDPMDYTVYGILQARTLEQLAFFLSRGSSQPRDGTQVSQIAGRIFTIGATTQASRSISLIFESYLHQLNVKVPPTPPHTHLNFSHVNYTF